MTTSEAAPSKERWRAQWAELFDQGLFHEVVDVFSVGAESFEPFMVGRCTFFQSI